VRQVSLILLRFGERFEHPYDIPKVEMAAKRRDAMTAILPDLLKAPSSIFL
jgi:hypothetical protein